MATPELAVAQARIQELEAQLAARLAAPAAPASGQRLKFPPPDKFFGGPSEPSASSKPDGRPPDLQLQRFQRDDYSSGQRDNGHLSRNCPTTERD